MNNDLISRSALIKWIDDSVSQYGHTYSTDMLNMWGLFKDYLTNNAPTVDPYDICKGVITGNYALGFHLGWEKAKERPQGEWIIIDDVYCECPFCKNKEVKFSKYCPECGARLKSVEKSI